MKNEKEKEKVYLKQYGYWALIGILLLWSIYNWVNVFVSHNESNNFFMPIEKSVDTYVVTKVITINPLVIDIQSVTNDKEMKEVYITEVCPQGDKIKIGTKVNLAEIKNKRVNGDIFVTYGGGYAKLCTSMNIDEIEIEDKEKEKLKTNIK